MITWGNYSPGVRCKTLLFFSPVCVFVTAEPITKLFARGGGGEVVDICYYRKRAEAYVK